MRYALLLTLALCACAERALDFGGASPDGLDLALVGARDGAVTDGAMTIADLADPMTPGIPGVPCAGDHCSVQETCCALPNGAVLACIPLGGMDTCTFQVGWRCDGPEDCAGDRRCVGNLTDEGAVEQTRCRRGGGMGGGMGGGVVICHTLADCPPGPTACNPIATAIAGGPALRVCGS